MAALLKQHREAYGISRRQLADAAKVNVSVVIRAERGADAKFSTWFRLFEGLGFHILWRVTETCEEAEDLHREEAQWRRDRQTEGLCAGKRRFS